MERVVTRSASDDGLVTNTFAYNTRGFLVHETATDAAVGLQSLGYRYNALGALAGITYPSGAEVDYAPNALGQPTRAGTYVSGLRYHPGGGMKEFTYGNGIVHSMKNNARQMPSRVMDSHGAIDVQYDYDVDGNPSAILDVPMRLEHGLCPTTAVAASSPQHPVLLAGQEYLTTGMTPWTIFASPGWTVAGATTTTTTRVIT